MVHFGYETFDSDERRSVRGNDVPVHTDRLAVSDGRYEHVSDQLPDEYLCGEHVGVYAG